MNPLISALRLVLQEHRQFPFDDGRPLHAVGLLQLANHLRAKEEEAAHQSTSAGEGGWDYVQVTKVLGNTQVSLIVCN